jgi:hypothetical protein
MRKAHILLILKARIAFWDLGKTTLFLVLAFPWGKVAPANGG